MPAVARVSDFPVDRQFLDRWSPRAFSPEPLTRTQVQTVLEAARWAPSSFNEQPWLFVFAQSAADLAKFRPLLMDQNRVWADQAPVLVLIFARRHFAHNGKANRHYMFDAGAAWMSLALQARSLGLYAHAMGGFHQDKAYETLGVPADRYEALCAVAIGRYGDAGGLPPALAEKESPGPRKALAEIAHEGGYRAQ